MPPSRARRYIGQAVTSTPLRITAAGVGLDDAARHAEAGRLAGAVGAQQADDLAAHAPRNRPVHDAAAADSFSPNRELPIAA